MPITVSYPGVYVQEIPPSGMPDSGVSTSLTAFIGRAPVGPVNWPVLLNSWADYQRFFGGLDADSAMSRQVSAFFANGGGQALGVRLFEPLAPGAEPAVDDGLDGACATVSVGDLVLAAAWPGAWGDSLTATVETDITPDQARAMGVDDPGLLFNLTVTATWPGGEVRTEQFDGVTLDHQHPHQLLTNVLATQSELVVYRSGGTVSAGTSGPATGGRDSAPLSVTTYLGDPGARTGLYALEKTLIFNIACIPPDEPDGDTPPVVYQAAAAYCASRNAMLILDPPMKWQADFERGDVTAISPSDLGKFEVEAARSAAVYFPRVLAADPRETDRIVSLPGCGAIAGVWAATDVQFGVWKAPAGLNAGLTGIQGPAAILTDQENGALNPQGINCLRAFPIGGTVIWGARTLRGDDQWADDYTYIPVRRLMQYLMNWTIQNTRWTVFEPNDERLWAQLRTQMSGKLNELWKQGALVGTSAAEAYFVRCDATTTSPDDIDAGVVNLQIGFAPIMPAEFRFLTIQLMAGQS